MTFAALFMMAAGCGSSSQPIVMPTVGFGLGIEGVVSTIAGDGYRGSINGAGSEASFNDPVGITTDRVNLYIADTYNNQIRVVGISSETVSTLAGSTTAGASNGTGTAATFDSPAGITTDGTNLYVADTDNHLIREINIATGVVTTLAGAGVPGYVDDVGASAEFDHPIGITYDNGNLYVADSDNNVIRQVNIASGQVTTLAGTGDSGGTNGASNVASFFEPSGITTDGTNLYVADSQNNMIREVVIATGAVTTLAGSTTPGSSDGIGAGASFFYPVGVVTDGTFVYVADTQNNTIREVTINGGAVVTLAGTAGTTGWVDGANAAAEMNQPMGMTTDGVSVYFADAGNEIIRKLQ